MQHLFLWSWRFTLQVGLSLWRLSKAVDAQLPSITLSQSWQTRNSFSIKLRSFSAQPRTLSFSRVIYSVAVFHQIEWKWCDCTQTHTYAISLWSAHACMSKDKSVFSFTRRAAALYIYKLYYSARRRLNCCRSPININIIVHARESRRRGQGEVLN